MAKRKDARVTVILECTSCIRNSDKKVSTGISRYITQKNRHNTPDRLEFKKWVEHLLCYLPFFNQKNLLYQRKHHLNFE